MNEQMKKEFLTALMQTRSWIKLEDLKYLLTEEQIREVINDRRDAESIVYDVNKLSSRYSKDEIEQELLDEVASTDFVIAMEREGAFCVKEFFAFRNPVTKSISLEDIEVTDIASVVLSAMEKHLEYGTFHGNSHLSATEIPRVLSENIAKAKEVIDMTKSKTSRESVDVEKMLEDTRRTFEKNDFEELDEEAIEKAKATAQQVSINYEYGNTIDAAVQTLLDYRKQGISTVITFNGHNLYSCDVTMDSAYQEITGQTKEEFEKGQEEYRIRRKEKRAREAAEAQANIPVWIEKGSEYIYPEKTDEWRECVESRANDLYNGSELQSALKIMEMLENGESLESAWIVCARDNTSAITVELTRDIVLNFSKQGPDFYEYTAFGKIEPEEQEMVQRIREENEKYERIHASDFEITAADIATLDKTAELTSSETKGFGSFWRGLVDRINNIGSKKTKDKNKDKDERE